MALDIVVVTGNRSALVTAGAVALDVVVTGNRSALVTAGAVALDVVVARGEALTAGTQGRLVFWNVSA